MGLNLPLLPHLLFLSAMIFCAVATPAEAKSRKKPRKTSSQHHQYQKGGFTKKGQYRKGHEKTKPDGDGNNNRRETYGR